jgi:hypothetical protein
VKLAHDGQRHLAIALASRSGLQFGDTLFQIGAAVTTKVGRIGERYCHATHDNAGRGHECHPSGTFRQQPTDHAEVSSWTKLPDPNHVELRQGH